ncbi:MAG TPA: hypothetical protein ENK85_02810 [Saprospiraceae bacterium]|nr:hypothetical protein [Saprospiraceae bacterium]
MSKVEKTNLEDNVYRISITLEKDDVQKEFTKKLKEYRKNAQWKGFRKGAAPLTFVKKMVGNQIYLEMIEKMTSKALFDKIDEDKFNYIGSPIAADDFEPPEIKMDQNEDIQFAFDLAVVPDFDIQEPIDHTFDYYKVNNLQEIAQKELEQAQLSMGTDEAADAEFDESATLTIKLTELDGDTPKEGGISHEATLRVAEIDNDKLIKTLAKAKVGDSFDWAPFEDLSVKDEKYIASTFLGLADDFEGELPQKLNAEIISATKKVPAEANQDFFDSLFGPGVVDSEEKALEKLVEFFEGKFTNEANQILMMNWKNYLLDNNQVKLPSEFIKKMIMATNDGIEEEAIDKDLPLIEKDLIWSTIRTNLVDKYEVAAPTEHEIKHAIAHSIGRQYGIDPHHEIIMNVAEETMQKDKSKVESTFNGLLDTGLFETVRPSLKTNDLSVSDTEFNEKIKETFE